jgi:glycine C-acetyltransferase
MRGGRGPHPIFPGPASEVLWKRAMEPNAYLSRLHEQTEALRAQGLFKQERILVGPQGANIRVQGGAQQDRPREVLNFCANNYLGLADDAAVIAAARQALERHGYGMASVRFICGTQDVHKELEAHLSRFLGTEDTILYSSCFDANGGLFETLLDEGDAVISDALNHASIIDGVRLSKATRYRYANNDMAELEARLVEAQGARVRLIATDGVFSMDGVVANLQAVCDLAEKHQALVMVDDSHAVGFMGAHGRGTHEHCGVMDRVHVLTGTMGKALGGAIGGYVSGRREIIGWLRQRSRPYLFSNSLPPAIAAASIALLERLESKGDLRRKLHENAAYFRSAMTKLGFTLAGAGHPIIPVMLGDARLASAMADRLLQEGIYVIGFSFPVVPKDKARIRTQISAAHEREHLDRAIAAFAKVGRELGVIR